MGVFGSSGVRGVVNDDLTPGFVERIAAAVGTTWPEERVAIGRDTRLSGDLLAHAASVGFMSVGVDVERIGVVPTPGLQDHLRRMHRPGCMVTASHNPREYNGLKFFGPDGVEVAGAGLAAIEQAVAEDEPDRARWDRIGEERHVTGIGRRYVDGIVDAVDAARIDAADLTVAVDPGHGAAYETTPAVCRELGCRVISVHATADGRFPGRSPEPVPGVLEELQRLVRAGDADVGVAHDGDADRVVFVDETGAFIDGNTVLALLASELVEPGDVLVTAVNASRRVADAVADAGGQLDHTAIGSAQLLDRIRTRMERGSRVPVAGESNGGLFLPEDRLARDGAFVLGRVLELVVDRPLGELAAEHAGYHLERRTLHYDSPGERAELIGALETAASNIDGEVDRTDGIRIDLRDGWILARPSGTEPLIRLTAEAGDRSGATALLDTFLSAIETN